MVERCSIFPAISLDHIFVTPNDRMRKFTSNPDRHGTSGAFDVGARTLPQWWVFPNSDGVRSRFGRLGLGGSHVVFWNGQASTTAGGSSSAWLPSVLLGYGRQCLSGCRERRSHGRWLGAA